MLSSSQHKQSQYFKQYPSYKLNSHLYEHKQLQFRKFKQIKFNKSTHTSKQLPKYLIDKYDINGQKMYWLEWKKENIIVNKTQNNLSQSQSKLNYLQSKKSTCLYISQLGQLSHLKFIFNYDPEIISIANRHLYIIGSQQLFITELWPQNIPALSKMSIQSTQQTNNHIISHQLQTATIISMDFVYCQYQRVLCKLIYFHEKKGLFAQSYSRFQQNTSTNFITKMIDFSYRFKKSYPCPIYYQTLIPNIIGIIFSSTKQFTLINLTSMTPISATTISLQDWQLDLNQPILIRTRQNQNLNQLFNDCLTISIGQGSNIQLFLYNIKYSSQIIVNIFNKPQPASQLSVPLESFTSAEVISFLQSKLVHYSIICLDDINQLKNYILTRYGIIFLGYKSQFSQIPVAGFISYIDPYTTWGILTEQYKIWKEYKIDILNKYTHNIQNIHRFLIPGRYDYQFIMKTMKIQSLNQLYNNNKNKNSLKMQQIQQTLIYEWRKQYKFIQFIIFKDQVLIIRKNTIGCLVTISEEQFISEYDQFSQIQINYDQLKSKGFQKVMDIQGDIVHTDVLFDLQKYKSGGYQYSSNGKTNNYQDKLKLTALQQSYQNSYFQHILKLKQSQNQQYTDFNHKDVKKYTEMYRKTMKTILNISKLKNIKYPDEQNQQQHNNNNQINSSSILQLSILGYRVKDRLRIYLKMLRLSYQYYFQTIYQQLNSQKCINHVQLYKKYENQHYRHMYITKILQFYVNLSTNLALLQQYQQYGHDLIDQFIKFYLIKHIKTQKIYKFDLQLHILNIIHLMFKGLVTQIPSGVNMSQIIDVTLVNDDNVIKQKIQQINNKNNEFLLMMNKKNKQLGNIKTNIHRQYPYQTSHMQISSILSCLFSSILYHPLNMNLLKFIPLSKTLLYTILQSNQLSYSQKCYIINSLLTKIQGLDMLILIQTENNLYEEIKKYNKEEKQVNNRNVDRMKLRMDQDGYGRQNYQVYQNNQVNNINRMQIQQSQYYDNQVSIVKDKLKKLQEYSVYLSHQSCYLIEQIMLIKSELFLYPQQQICEFYDALSYILYKNIQYTAINIVPTKTQKRFQLHNSMIIQQMLKKLNRYFVDQQYNILKKDMNLIDSVFRKYYNKIYHFNTKNPYKSQSNQHQNYTLSWQQLNMISKLYKKYDRQIRKLNNIQQKLNLQYAMIRIHLYRFKTGVKQLKILTESGVRLYSEILGECLRQIQFSSQKFKNIYPRMFHDKNQIIQKLKQKQFIQILNLTIKMQNSSKFINNNGELSTDSEQIQDINHHHNDNNNNINYNCHKTWLLCGNPITQQWINLLLLTIQNYSQQQQKKYFIQFVNYNDERSLIMKLLTVIFKGNYKYFNDMINIYKKEKLQQIIIGNSQLIKLYQNTDERLASMLDKNKILKKYPGNTIFR